MKMPCLFLILNLSHVAFAAYPAPPPSAPPTRSVAELEKLAAPIALYPDPLIAVMLPASAYPADIVLAARFVADPKNVPKLDQQNWDENVKAVARVPDAIQKMDKELAWTTELGQAFIEQPQELMETIQALRAKAQSVGALKSSSQQAVVVTNAVVERYYEQQVVYVTNTIVQIQPSNPKVVYVPQYNPATVYVPPPPSGPPPIVTFAAGIAVGAIIANNCDWHYGGVVVGGHGGVAIVGGGHGAYYPPPPGYRPPPYRPPPGYRPPPAGYRPPGYPPPGAQPTATYGATSQRWQPNQSRLSTAGPSPQVNARTQEARGWGSSGVAGSRPGAEVSSGSRSLASPNVNRSSPSTSPARTAAAPSPSVSRSAKSSTARESAFGGVSSGAGTRSASSRGATSRGSLGGERAGGRASRR